MPFSACFCFTILYVAFAIIVCFLSSVVGFRASILSYFSCNRSVAENIPVLNGRLVRRYLLQMQAE